MGGSITKEKTHHEDETTLPFSTRCGSDIEPMTITVTKKTRGSFAATATMARWAVPCCYVAGILLCFFSGDAQSFRPPHTNDATHWLSSRRPPHHPPLNFGSIRWSRFVDRCSSRSRVATNLRLQASDSRGGKYDGEYDGEYEAPTTQSVSSTTSSSSSGAGAGGDVSSSSASSSSSPPSSVWSMKKDWALLDNVPKFTISTPTETRTFWAQLWSSTPILFSSETNPEALHRRMVELKEEEEENEREQQLLLVQDDDTRSSDDGRLATKRRLPAFGPSPPVLQNWQIDFTHQKSGRNGGGSNNRVVGQIADNNHDDDDDDGGIVLGGGRTVWFHYHVVGRLRGDPLSDLSSSVLSLIPGGYLEAVGGRIYELGQPMLLNEWNREQQHKADDRRRYFNDNNPLNGKNNGGGSSTADAPDKSLGWWIPAGTATVSALVASTILSACIGYGAGLSMIEDPHYSSHGQTSFSSSSSSTSLYYGRQQYSSASPSSGVVTITARQWQQLQQLQLLQQQQDATTTTTAIDPTTQQQLPSIEELRARTEYRVLREQRLLDTISQKLERDQQTLRRLDMDNDGLRLLP